MANDRETKPVFFPDPAHFRKWLEENHLSESELLIGYYKVHTKKPSMSWSDSVDEALCFGWIDGIRKSIDDESYCIRFTPRNPKSNWSAVNIRKVEELKRLGKMTPAGLVAYEKRQDLRSEIYSYENRPEKMDSILEIRFREQTDAWEYFLMQSPSYQKTIIFWVMSAKRETTRIARLDRLIDACKAGERIF